MDVAAQPQVPLMAGMVIHQMRVVLSPAVVWLDINGTVLGPGPGTWISGTATADAEAGDG